MDYSIKKPNIKFPKDCRGSLPSHFEVEHLPSPNDGFCMGLIGMRGSGKTLCLQNLLTRFYKGCFDAIFIFSPTAVHNDPTLSPESLDLPEYCFKEKIDTELIKSIMKKQHEDKIQYDKDIKAKDKRIKPDPLKRILFVIDDCLSDEALSTKTNSNANIINALMFKARHYGISIFLSSQYYKALPPKTRVNIPNWIFFATQNGKERKSIEEEQSGNISEKKFNMMFDYATQEPYAFFYIYGLCPDRNNRYRKNIDTVLSINE